MRKILLFIILIISISAQAQNDVTFDTSYLPHRIHDYWQYKVVSATGRSYTYTVEITGTESFEGANCYRFVAKTPALGNLVVDHFYSFTNRERVYHGSIIPADGNTIKKNPGVVLPASNSFPAAGVFSETFHNPGEADNVYDNCHYSYRMNGTDNFWFRPGSTVFRAIKLDHAEVVTKSSVNYNMMETSETEWYVKGIGLVKSESRNPQTHALLQTTTLIKAKINGLTFQ